LRTRRQADWHRASTGTAEEFGGNDVQGRLAWLTTVFAVLAIAVFSRVVALEWFYGEAYRAEAARPMERTSHAPGVRGRILARDGTVLAYDREILSLAVEYRYLEQPPDARWLEKLARRRLPIKDRRRRERVAAEIDRVRADLTEKDHRLAKLCERTVDDLRRRGAAIQGRVSQISQRVNQRRHERFMARIGGRGASKPAESSSWLQWLETIAFPPDDETAPQRIAVVEELEHHVVFRDVSLDVVAQIESHPELYPGARIVTERRRTYPAATLAAHVVGHLGPVGADDLLAKADDDERRATIVYAACDEVGKLGAERRFEPILHAASGTEIERTDRGGRWLETEQRQAAGVGRDLVLTIDPALQRTAESLLDSSLLRRRAGFKSEQLASGGAVIVLDVANGAILASASAPRFDPNAFSGDSETVTAILNHPGNALFDRVTRMALPVGSVFKVLTAVALIETGTLEAHEPFECRGYLHSPDAQRCQIFRRFGMGHGEVTLVDALARSCNVYFFHHAGEMGPDPLVDWATRFGFGRPTGVDLPEEASGNLPSPVAPRAAGGSAWRIRDTQALAIGQSELTATPLQVARLMAAIANGGRLVTPHVAARLGLPESAADSFDDDRLAALLEVAAPREIAGLSAVTLETVRNGLSRVVASPDGTAHRTTFLDSVAIAGKTGTAETGSGEDHAWFAGYVPAASPRIAFVVVLEHAGNGGESAGPVVKRLVMRLEELGYL